MTTRRRWIAVLIFAFLVVGLVWFGLRSRPPKLSLVFLGLNPDINSPLSLASRPQRASFCITNSGPVTARITGASFVHEDNFGNFQHYRLSLDRWVLEPGRSMELESLGIRAGRACQLHVNFGPENLSGRLSRSYHYSTNVFARVVGRRLFPFQDSLSTNSDWITNSSGSHKKDMQVINR